MTLRHGAIAIAAITSCTTATDPAMMVAAGLLARNAVERGLQPLPWVKKVLAPAATPPRSCSLARGLLEPLARAGLPVCGFGCMSCIGSSGSIAPQLHGVADRLELTSVLSGNRNFDAHLARRQPELPLRAGARGGLLPRRDHGLRPLPRARGGGRERPRVPLRPHAERRGGAPGARPGHDPGALRRGDGRGRGRAQAPGADIQRASSRTFDWGRRVHVRQARSLL